MLLFLLSLLMVESDFKQEEVAWRAERTESMKAENSWLNLAGLYWLKEGETTFGTGEDAGIRLPRFSTVSTAGSFFLENGKVRYKMNRGQRMVVDEKTQNEGELELNKTIAHNNLRFILIERDNRMAIRLRDLRSKVYTEFKALDFFSPRKKYRIKAVYEPYDEPETIVIQTFVETEVEMIVPGEIKFKLNGTEVSLLPTLGSMEDEQFFIIFKDQTAGNATYGGGRFLYADRPLEGNQVILNFNRAINPPCAYTPYATCPLPPSDNWLSVSIEAGERLYRDGHHDEDKKP